MLSHLRIESQKEIEKIIPRKNILILENLIQLNLNKIISHWIFLLITKTNITNKILLIMKSVNCL